MTQATVSGIPETASVRSGGRRYSVSQKILMPVLVLFLLSCVFDPADKLLGAKVQLFVLAWFISIVLCAASRERCSVHIGLLIYVLIFVAVPLLSIARYWFIDGGTPFEGFQLFKGYLLITLSALLFINRIDLMSALSRVLSLLSVVIIVVYLTVTFQPDFYGALYLFGEVSGTVLVDRRDYGDGLVMLQVYFVTSPMLAFAIAHYFYSARVATGGARLKYTLLTLLNAGAMMLAGTRNNLAVSVMLPIALYFLYSKNKTINAVLTVAVVFGLIVVFSTQIEVLLDPREFSNSVKLALLNDYSDFFGDTMGLLFGEGLGAYRYWTAKGTSFFTSELTYLELIRNFGIFGALLMCLLLAFPIVYAFVMNRDFEQKNIVVGYAFYLLMCLSNPNLFSSMGILILSVVLANLFMIEGRREMAAAGARS
ncbi:hypothetical protein [Peristeroidobacter soli]|uniref:hypothetical protein n=1 Tax=Peristeroidobacter soli TaxID=2497877 RepID=UPI00101CA0D1|nr:hypothetical protein [Peristeroidobacter soli]